MVQLNQQGDKKNQNELFLTGTSFDEKPIKINGSYPPQFSMFYEIDTGVCYIFDYENKEWVTSDGASYIPEGAATTFVVKVIQDETTGEWKIYNNGGTITTIQYDNEPTANSKNLVNSGNLYTYIQNHSGGGGSTEGVGRKNPDVTGAEEFNQYGADYRAQGTYSHAEGSSYAVGDYSHAEGDNSGAVGLSSHVEGHSNTAQGDYSHAEGWSTNALGIYSHTEGKSTRITEGNIGGHAEGLNTLVDGNYAHAEGDYTKANGNNSHSEGNGAIADGDNSHAGGRFTHATNQNQVAIGEFNEPKTDTTQNYRLGTIVEIGNGTSSARSNIVEVYYDKVNINGDIYKNGQPLFGGLSFVKCTQAEYDAIATPDPNTVYIIVG